MLFEVGDAFDSVDSKRSNICVVKKKWVSAQILIFPNPSEFFVLYCDASMLGMGGVLMQNRQVMAYAYLTHDLELAAIMFVIKI